MRIIVDGEDTDPVLMELESDKRRKKPRKVVKRKSVRRGKEEHVDELTSKVGGLKVEGSAEAPNDYIGETRSQPGSRRGSTLPSAFLANPAEAARRASNASIPGWSRRGSQVRGELRGATVVSSCCALQVVDHSGVRAEVTRRGSIKRGSITWDEEGDLEAKKLKAALDAMGMLKKKQKEFTWDAVNPASSEESENKNVGWKNPEAGRMTKDQALKTLGLGPTTGGKTNKPRNVTDYSEYEITSAFQKESKSLSKKL